MSAPHSPTILIYEHVTGGGMAGEPLPGSWAAEGLAMRLTLAAEFAAALGATTRVVATLDPRFPPEHGPWTTLRINQGSCVDQLREAARRADYTLVIAPETMGALERLTRIVEETGTIALGSTPEAVALTADKAALGRWLHRRGIPTPRCRVVEPSKGLPSDCPIPAVLKPIDGAGSIDTYRIDDPARLPEGAGEISIGLLQPLVPGAAMSASFLVSPARGVFLIAIGRQRIEVRDERFSYSGGELPAPCPEAAPLLKQAVESIPGLRGFVGVDFLWDEDRREATILEINPRPTTSCVGLRQALSPGLLADAWLASAGFPERWDGLIDQIAREISAAPSIRFDADGRIMAIERST